MSRRIIVPLDRSHVAECAIPYARALARETGFPLTLITVLHPSSALPEPAAQSHPAAVEEPVSYQQRPSYSASLPFGQNPGAEDVDLDEFEEAASERSEAQEYLEYVANSIVESETTTLVDYGEPVDRIVHAASGTDEMSDLPILVMASHGRSGLGRLLLGSVALSVAERATCPMLICRAMNAPVPSVEEISLDKIFIPLDGSDSSEAILGPVRSLFDSSRKSVHLLSVVDLDRSWVTGEPTPRDADGRTSRDAAEQYLTSIADGFRVRGHDARWDVVEGKPSDRINQIAEDAEADLIAMATHGRSGLQRFTVGSVAEEVLNRATRPLLMVRPS